MKLKLDMDNPADREKLRRAGVRFFFTRPSDRFFSSGWKETLTRKVAELICLALFCAGTIFLEYKMLLFFGAAFVAFAGASALAVISSVLYRTPEGDERADGLHIRQRNRPTPFLLARSAGSAGFQEPRTHESLNSKR
jgi:hypothetical protein